MVRTSILGCVVVLLVAGCGDDDGGTDGGAADGGRADGGVGTDGGTADDGGSMDSGMALDGGMDGGDVDAGPIDGSMLDSSTDGGSDAGADAGWDSGPIDMITVTGVIEGEDLGSGAPPIEGATVSIDFPNGVMLASTTTAADGTYSVTSAADMVMLLRVEPLTDYVGNLRAEAPSSADYSAYLVRLAHRTGVENVVSDSGSTYDPAKGLLVAGYNPVSVADGGEGATLGGVTHDPAFVLYPGGLVVTNILPHICTSGETPAADGCALAGRNESGHVPEHRRLTGDGEHHRPGGGHVCRAVRRRLLAGLSGHAHQREHRLHGELSAQRDTPDGGVSGGVMTGRRTPPAGVIRTVRR